MMVMYLDAKSINCMALFDDLIVKSSDVYSVLKKNLASEQIPIRVRIEDYACTDLNEALDVLDFYYTASKISIECLYEDMLV